MNLVVSHAIQRDLPYSCCKLPNGSHGTLPANGEFFVIGLRAKLAKMALIKRPIERPAPRSPRRFDTVMESLVLLAMSLTRQVPL